MASLGHNSGRAHHPTHRALPRLYRFALALSVNEELARSLLRAACKALSTRKDWREEERDHLIEAFRRIYALWSTKLAENPNIHNKCAPQPRLFGGSLLKGPLAGNSHFAKFIVTLPPSQRAALYLVYGERTSYDEAADVIAVDMLALMKLLARGHLALAHWLDHRGLNESGSKFGSLALGIEPALEREYAA
jgi:RNA polymerase sigma-70 factor (ECF subfamily)